MRLISHSNGLHTVDKEKLGKIAIIKRCIIFFIGLLILGFVIQMVTDFVDNLGLKSKFKYVRIDGKKIEYKLKSSGGSDYTVVFDGEIGANMYEWDKVCKTLEADKKLSTFVYNRRGYEFNDGGDLMTPEEQAKILKNLLKKAGAPEPYIFVGEEYGSLVATNFAKLYPESVAGAVLVNPLSEENINTEEFKNSIKYKYYRSEFEKIGSNFGLTSLMSKMGLTIENKSFEENIDQNELEEFNKFKNKKNYKEAVSNELKNLYRNASESQTEGLLSNKPLCLITSNDDDSIKKIGNQSLTTVVKSEANSDTLSLLDSDEIVNGINTTLKEVRKLAKSS
ncbi:alpha/beta fold hydrolase [Clostridium saccharobutylicum]|uniref:Putative hydrolase or acyltransferase of alpha/beta superfamily n=1 Tax=Clostridium saccharobutylicum DSM 13864 TaxID=1345695 RepID=U5MQ05_CLOSA|nr:alpha/beta hydrolase [Clostridium saccharobutylicum]AGX41497.1 putative hydrolase or acyltransferase of alpha/beta superfamily [Clostridium saccharobutylicum DSM 13864]AQR88777.1 alpha/beta hydrolase family protein [Clostridium saccharobutylicum]AQR98675.1 alpha/beta hydrolase family protein [Clostridium saccharobutylicum]AQS12665.1 alpha/beta hydrolase family protein [Clostridium saccharobutylicum]MBA2904224.1 hypothetical protein [Clostridium saccharobutylicum]